MNARNRRARRISLHLTSYRGLELPECGGGPVGVLVDRRAGDEHRRTCRRDARRVLGLDAAIDLELRSEPARVQLRADRAHFRDRALDELLAAEARMNAHDEREIDGVEM